MADHSDNTTNDNEEFSKGFVARDFSEGPRNDTTEDFGAFADNDARAFGSHGTPQAGQEQGSQSSQEQHPQSGQEQAAYQQPGYSQQPGPAQPGPAQPPHSYPEQTNSWQGQQAWNAPNGQQPGFTAYPNNSGQFPPQAPRTKTPTDGFFSGLLDFSFDKFITVGYASAIYVIGIIILGCTWLLGLLLGFVFFGPFGIITAILVTLICFGELIGLRLFLEFAVANIRTTQYTREILHRLN
ncbi:DUF4282 domain-containing protein [Corynebacterium accolens]|uniref:DUF4282 domain-containing protein n=1 Tax=Corynebacterium accolens TaxID=38284 RepID=UPI001EDA30AB|nr:DUF4282 domain-containing protein [Corynebacterium accolens]